MTLPDGVREADVEAATAEVYRVFEDRPLAAQIQMNGLLAGELARAALTAALAGRVVVPREPTREMILAGARSTIEWRDATPRSVYASMIDAATAAPSATVSPGDAT